MGMENLDAMLKELGAGAEIVIHSDFGLLRGYVYDIVGGERFEMFSASDEYLEDVIRTLDAQALAWLSE
jgi:hypothetical protein